MDTDRVTTSDAGSVSSSPKTVSMNPLLLAESQDYRLVLVNDPSGRVIVLEQHGLDAMGEARWTPVDRVRVVETLYLAKDNDARIASLLVHALRRELVGDSE